MMCSRFRKGEIYLFDLADSYINVQSGLRPCLIIQNELGNIYSPTVIVVPITTKLKKTDLPVHVITENYFMGKKTIEMILCEQILTVPKSRIKKYLRTLDKVTLREVEKAVEVSLGIDVIGGD